jgi:hypothetical protein
MHPKNREAIENRIVNAAEAALARQGYVSAIDVLTGSGMLQSAHVAQWRQGRLDFLERMVQGNLNKISLAMSMFRKWAAAKNLKPSETIYVRSGRGGKINLRFSKSGDPKIEKSYRTHYVSAELSERKQARLQEKLDSSPDPVVFEIIRESACSECGTKIEKNDLLFMEAGQPLCLACARMDDLEYLPSGDAALTRRSAKYSARKAVVVRFSKSRGRYERQGILAEPAAIQKAEEECFDDEGYRATRRKADAERRKAEDKKLTTAMTSAIAALFPGCPPAEAAAIAAHTAVRGSGRVGRTAAGRKLDNAALTAAVAAAVRHRHTNYDELLVSGVERALARANVRERADEILESWQETRPD